MGGIPWAVDETALCEYLNSLGAGKVFSCRIITDRDDGRPKGYGYADVGESTQTKLCAITDASMEGRTLRFDQAEKKQGGFGGAAGGGGASGGRFANKEPSAPSSTLFIGNLPWSANADELYNTFTGATNIRVPTDRETGEIRGFGYAEYGSTEEAKAALESLNGTAIDGRNIRLDFAAEKKDFASGGGGGGGGGGFSGGRGGGRGGGRPPVQAFAGTKISFD